MLLVTIFIFSVLLAMLYKMTKDLLFPPVIFTAVWLSSMIGVLISGDSMHEIGGPTYLVYLIGAISFSIGGVVIFNLKRGNIKAADQNSALHSCDPRSIHTALDIALIIVIIGLPLYWREMRNLAGNAADSILLLSIRTKSVELQDERSTFSIVNNFSVLSLLIAVAMAYEMDGSNSRKWRAVIASVVSLAYGFMYATKTPIIYAILYVFFVTEIKRRKVNLKHLAAIISISATLFCIGIIIFNYAYMSFDGVWDMFTFAFGGMLQNYWLGPIVAFDQLVYNPHLIVSTQPIYRFFLETARSLGMNVYVPPLHADFLSYSAYGDTNAYTIYLAYFKDYGWFGMVGLMLLLGAGLACIHKKALRGGPVAVQFYAMMCAGIVLSFSAEHFLLGLNFYIKAGIFYYVLYKMVPAVHALRRRKQAQHA